MSRTLDAALLVVGALLSVSFFGCASGVRTEVAATQGEPQGLGKEPAATAPSDPAQEQEPRAPIVAVIGIDGSGADLKDQVLRGAEAFAAAALSADGRFRLVPEATVREALTAAKTESYRQCFDEGCQIELGRELAAEQVLVGRVFNAGGRCTLSLQLFDLRTATAIQGGSASAVAKCSEELFFRLLDNALTELGVRPPTNVRLGAEEREEPVAGNETPAAPAPELTPERRSVLVQTAREAFLRSECASAKTKSWVERDEENVLQCYMVLQDRLSGLGIRGYAGHFHLGLGGDQVVLLVDDPRAAAKDINSSARFVFMRKPVGAESGWLRVAERTAGWSPEVRGSLTDASGRERLVTCSLNKGSSWPCARGECELLGVYGRGSAAELLTVDLGIPVSWPAGPPPTAFAWSVDVQDVNGDGVSDIEFVIAAFDPAKDARAQHHVVRVLSKGDFFEMQGALPYTPPPSCPGL